MFLAAVGSMATRSVVIGAVLLAEGGCPSSVCSSPPNRFVVLVWRRLARFAPCGVRRSRRVYLVGNGEIVAPLDQVRFERRMQIASSAPKLVATRPAPNPRHCTSVT